jgi:altronate hydrolase
MGGAAVLTEIPETFGAEACLLNRAVSEDVFQKALGMINAYKAYFTAHGQPVSENPSPGNKDGGITTLEEKSLGCILKGGRAPLTAVLRYGDFAAGGGLQLLDGPGNDMAAVTNLTAAGCHLILFTTGRGTPLGAPVPTIKIASNTKLAERKRNWIDFNAQTGDADGLFTLLLATANGRQTKNEINACREIAIFKDGVTL